MSRNTDMDPAYGLLYDRLLLHGGVAVTAMPEEDIDKILARGYLRTGGRTTRVIHGMEPSQCHRNAAHVWAVNYPDFVIAVGWALSDDGIWRQHTWLRHIPTGQLYETTERRELYFGFDLTEEETKTFREANA